MSPFSEKLGMVLVELHSGACLMVQERADMLWFMERGLCQMSYDEDGGRDTIRYDTADGSCRQASAAVFGSEADHSMPCPPTGRARRCSGWDRRWSGAR